MSKLNITHSKNHLLSGDSAREEFKLSYEQGEEGGRVQFSLVCNNIPVGSTVGFSADKPGPDPPIYLPPTLVTIFPAFITGIVSQILANYAAEITYYVVFSQTPTSGASVEFQAAIIAQS